jgi:hypothetical protein
VYNKKTASKDAVFLFSADSDCGSDSGSGSGCYSGCGSGSGSYSARS